MALVNRDKDVSEQRTVVACSVRDTVVGGTYPLFIAPYACTLDAASQFAYGLSGAPNHQLNLYRFVPGAGVTNIGQLGASLVTAAYGTSGAQTFTIISGTGTTFPLQAGDAVYLTSAGANTAVQFATVHLVVKALQDIKTHYGV